jgi:hypothetical protein
MFTWASMEEARDSRVISPSMVPKMFSINILHRIQNYIVSCFCSDCHCIVPDLLVLSALYAVSLAELSCAEVQLVGPL